MLYLTLKTIHIIFIISWFAMLFYLPRIFVNLAQTNHTDTYDTLIGMSYRLLRFGNKLAAIALITGFWMMFQFKIGHGHLWLHIKLTCVALLVTYHFWCAYILRQFKKHQNTKNHIYYRFFNEIPVLLLVAIIYLVIFKPF